MNKLNKTLIVHTTNKVEFEEVYSINRDADIMVEVPNYRFGKYYLGSEDNYDRLTIVGIPSESDNTLRIGLAFCGEEDNFSRGLGTFYAEMKAQSLGTGRDKFKPYTVVRFTEEEFTLKNALVYLYELHEKLINMSIKEVKKEIAKQIVK